MRMARLDPRGEKVALVSSILHEMTCRLGFDNLRINDRGRSQWVLIGTEQEKVRMRRGWWENLLASNLVKIGGYVGDGASKSVTITQMGKDWIKR